MLRDQGFVRQVHSTQNLGRRVFNEQRDFRRANPGFNRLQRAAPRTAAERIAGTEPHRQQPGSQNRPGQQQPGLQNRPGQQQHRVSRTGPDNSNCRTGRVNRNCSNRARLTGRVSSNCSGRDHAIGFAARNRLAAAPRSAASNRGTAGRSRASVRPCNPARLRKPVAAALPAARKFTATCARRPAVRHKAFSNPASGKACGRAGLRRVRAPPPRQQATPRHVRQGLRLRAGRVDTSAIRVRTADSTDVECPSQWPRHGERVKQFTPRGETSRASSA